MTPAPMTFHDLPKAPGTYAIALHVGQATSLRVGRRGEYTLASGVYLYVGSAHGPGGLRARLGRHLAAVGRPHWHIDYLRATVRPVGVLVRRDCRRQECAWSRWLLRQGAAVVTGFGASDCRCQGHLYHAGTRPQLKALLEMATADLGARYLDTIGLGADGARRDGPEPCHIWRGSSGHSAP